MFKRFYVKDSNRFSFKIGYFGGGGGLGHFSYKSIRKQHKMGIFENNHPKLG